MKPASKKSKARLLQNLVRDWIVEAFRLEQADVLSTPMGVQGADVKLSPKAYSLFPYAVECKNVKRVAVYGYYEQACAHSEKDKGEPVVFIKANRKKPLVVIDAQHFIKLVKYGRRQNRKIRTTSRRSLFNT